MAQSYNASDIEVLSGLDPVRRRPGMYTDTSRPNHLAHEVVDNSVDEAMSGHAKRIDVKVYKDGSLEVADDGRGMPVDIHPKEKVSGVELILTKLHAGGKFNDKNYKFAGGLHGVGVSVVNALSKKLETWVKRGGKEYHIAFAGGKPTSKLKVVGDVGSRNTGTRVRFWPDASYFDAADFLDPETRSMCSRPRRCCAPGLHVTLGSRRRREGRVAVLRRPEGIPDRVARAGRVAAAGTVHWAASKASRKPSIGRSRGASMTARASRKATST